MSKNNEKDKTLKSAIMQIEKEYGKGAVIRLGSRERTNIPFIPTGALNLDVALGIGGVPRGRVIEIYGPESSGKTTLTLHICASAQKYGGIVGFVDAEHALDPSYAARLGVDVDNLYVAQPDFGEQALSILEALVKSATMDVIVVDSVAALVPKAEIDGNIGDAHMALQARLMSQALRKLTGVISKSGTCVIFINQIRSKVGVIFGSPETTTGGKALKFYSSVRLDIRRIESLKQGDNISGIRVRVKVVKNKVAPPFKIAEFDIMFADGISQETSIIDLASNIGIIKRSGAWYSYGTERLAQGKANLKKILAENKKLTREIEDKILKHYDIQKPAMINAKQGKDNNKKKS